MIRTSVAEMEGLRKGAEELGDKEASPKEVTLELVSGQQFTQHQKESGREILVHAVPSASRR